MRDKRKEASHEGQVKIGGAASRSEMASIIGIAIFDGQIVIDMLQPEHQAKSKRALALEVCQNPFGSFEMLGRRVTVEPTEIASCESQVRFVC